MKHSLIVIAVLGMLLASPSAMGDKLRNVKIGEEIPPFTVTTVNGKEVSSADLRGKVVVLVFVAAEQRSSERASKVASTLVRELRKPDVVVLFMTADVTRLEFFRQQRLRLGIQEPLGLDVARKVYGGLGLLVLPTTIIIDREGRLAHVISSVKADHAHVLRARVRHTLGALDDEQLAEELTSKGFKRDRPEDRIARRRAAARLLRRNGLLDDAAKELAAALEIDPDHADAQLDLASLRLAEKRLDEAEAIVERVMAASPRHRRGTLISGAVAYYRGRLEEAEKVLRNALLLNPDPVWTHYYLGLTCERQGDEAAAAEHFKEALSRVLVEHPM
ncbi:MAG: tetratricopeptide repeat protein [Planctomycetes bacterium]|nr:tetratricopeptide repeat protein [Planctomycetota bacterium]